MDTTTTTPISVTPKTAVISSTEIITDVRIKKINNIASLGSSIGFVGGLVYAFNKKKGFWGYVGFGLLFSIIGGTMSGLGARALIKKQK